MIKFICTALMAVVLTGCGTTVSNQHANQSSKPLLNTKSVDTKSDTNAINIKPDGEIRNAPSHFAKTIASEYLNTVLVHFQNDEREPYNDEYKACFTKPYPKMELEAQKLAERYFDDKQLGLIDEIYALELQNRSGITSQEKEQLNQIIIDKKEALKQLGVPKAPQIIAVLYPLIKEDVAKARNQEDDFINFTSLAGQRMIGCLDLY